MEYVVLSILDAIALGGEDAKHKAIEEFNCAKSPSIQRFVRNNAVDFAKQGISMTHLVYGGGEDPALLGFFSLTFKILRLAGGNLSRTSEKRIARFAEHDTATNTYTLPAPLIAQFGKNDLPEGSRPFSGKELIAVTESKLVDVMAQVGGRAVYLECEDEPKLMSFYESCGYVHAAQRYDKTGEKDALYHIFVKFLAVS